MRDFDVQIMQLIQNKSEEEVEEIVIQLCNNYGLNYYQAKRYIDDLLAKLK